MIGDPSSDLITGVTYGGAPMTLVAKGQASARWTYLFYLSAPAAGTANIVATASSACFIEINAASHNGIAQSGQPEAQTAFSGTTGATSRTTSVTTISDNAWVILAALGQGGGITAGSGTTLRATNLVGAILDSGGPVTPAGAKALIHNQASSNAIGGIAMVLAPASGGSDATASGATVTAAASLIAGNASASGGGTALGATLTAAASLIAGAASAVINGVLNFQAAGMEFGARTGLEISTFALDAGVSYRYSVHADGLTLGSAILTSSAITLDGAGKLPNLISSSLTPGTNYRVVAIRQSDGEAAIFRMEAA